MENTNSSNIVDQSANPAPLGLLGFGLTTILLNIHNAGIFPVNSIIMGMGLFIGGLAQVIAGVLEWKKGNTFGTTAFSAYGFFWIALVFSWVLPKIGFIALDPATGGPITVYLAQGSNEVSMGFFLLLWGLFTLGMFFGTLRLNKALQVVFLSLTLLFFLLAARDFLLAAGIPAGKTVGTIAGIVGIICGFSAFYTAIAQVLNEIYGKVVLPIGPVA
jgi:succinate-acetate transporter protein